jgi:hypothetical protein
VTRPPVFQSATFVEALERAEAKGLWLIVAATSSTSTTCGAMCRAMDEVSWRGAKVGDWLEDHALALQLDIDADAERARSLGIRAAPAVVAYRAGEEKARVVGFHDRFQLLQWLESLERGPSERDRLRGQITDPERDPHGRLAFAKVLLRQQDYENATDQFVWLWHNMARISPGMRGVRVSFLASEIRTLVGVHAPARTRFTQLREDAGRAAEADPRSRETRFDWGVLNEILGDDARTMAWFEDVKADPNAADVVEGLSRFLQEPLEASGRWADLGRIFTNPLAELTRQHRLIAMPGSPRSAMIGADALVTLREFATERFRKTAAMLLGGLRAAGRTREADAVRAEALRLDPSTAMESALARAHVRYD